MQPSQVKLVQDSFEKVALLGDKVAGIFYSELFAIDPSLRPLFKNPMHEQGKMLLATLALVVRSLHQPEKILAPAEALAVRHVKYGVKAEHYSLVGNALLRTLKKGLGDKFTPELRDAWIAAYQLLANVMRDAAYGKGNWQKGAA